MIVPCIDLMDGKVVQLVQFSVRVGPRAVVAGGGRGDGGTGALKVRFHLQGGGGSASDRYIQLHPWKVRDTL